MAKKGNEIKFVKGAFEGKQGWLDVEKGKTAKMIYVIVDNGDGTTTNARVNKDSISAATMKVEPSSYTEAMLQQHPDIDKHMNKLCAMFAECEVVDNAGADLFSMIGKTPEEADTKHKKAAHKAPFRKVAFSKPE